MFLDTAVYVGTDGTYFDVLDALPDAPPGSVIVNVPGILFGLEAGDLGLLRNWCRRAPLGPNWFPCPVGTPLRRENRAGRPPTSVRLWRR